MQTVVVRPSYFFEGKNIVYYMIKHWQRHNEPKGCVLLPKWLFLNHVTRISTKLQHPNLDHVSCSKCWPIFKHKILTELQLQNLDQYVQIQNLDQTSASKSYINRDQISASESRPSIDRRLASKNLTKVQLLKYLLNLNFNILTKPCSQSLNNNLAWKHNKI